MTYASIVEYVSHYAQERPETPAVIVGDRVTTYRELWRLVRGFAYYLQKIVGVRKGDIVLAKASQTTDYMVLYFSSLLSGGIFTPVENTASGEGFDRIVKEFAPKLIAVNPGDMESASPWRDRCISNLDVCRIAEQYAGDAENEPFRFPAGNDPAVVMFTTGTTGVSKGVEHTQWSMLAAAENLAANCEMKQGTCYLIPGPMNHAGPLRKSAMTIVRGGTLVIINGMKNMRAIFEAIEQAPGLVGASFVPAAMRVIFAMTGDKLGEYADKIDFIVTDGAVFSEKEKARLCDLLPKTRLYNNYGASEFGNASAYDFNRYPGKRNCVGKPGPYSKIVVVDENRQVIDSSPQNVGLLACMGDVNMKGYWNAPELTAQVMHDGMVCSNDVGYIDEDGFVYLLGRQGDVINVGGLKVAPADVEEMALNHPSIEDCVCIPVDDLISGKAAKLCVVLKPGEALDVKGIRSHLMAHLENFKLPKYIVAVDELPKLYNGKLDRKTAIARFADR